MLVVLPRGFQVTGRGYKTRVGDKFAGHAALRKIQAPIHPLPPLSLLGSDRPLKVWLVVVRSSSTPSS